MRKNNFSARFAPKYSLAAAALVAISVNVQAADVAGSFTLGVGHSNNIGRDGDVTLDEDIARVGMRLDVTEDSRALEMAINADVTYQWYESGFFDDEVVGGVNAFADFTLIDERLTWNIQDDYGQVLRDAFIPSRPDNREDVNFFSTGPRLTMPLSSRNNLNVDLDYSLVTFANRPFDNDRKSAQLALVRQVRENIAVSLTVMGERTSFDQVTVTDDFDRYEAYLGYDGTHGRNTYSLELGHTEVDVQGETSNGMLASIGWTRQMSSVSTLTLTGGSRFSDQGNIFRLYQDFSRLPGATTGDLNNQSQPFRNDYAHVAYNYERNRNTLDLRVGWNAEVFDEQPEFDRDAVSADLFLGRDLSRRFFLNLDVRYDKRDFADVNRSDTDIFAGLSIGYRLNAAFNVRVQLSRVDRDSDQPGNDFTEDSIFLTLAYVPAWGRQ